MNEKELKHIRELWVNEPTIMFLLSINRITVEQVMNYCLERINHYTTIAEYKQELLKDIGMVHKKNMEMVKFNIKKLFV